MTKKDYVLIAATIRELRGRDDYSANQIDRIAEIFAAKLARENGAFRLGTFLAACGVS